MSDNKRRNIAPITEGSYPSNSHKSKEDDIQETTDEKELEQIVTGKVVKKRKSLTRRFTEAFTEEDRESVGDHIIYDVLIPAAKNTISEMVKGGIDMFLFGSVRGSNTRRDRGRSYVNYSDIYSTGGSRRPQRHQISPRNRARHNFDDIVLESRGEAEEVLSRLVDLIIEYGMVTVADLYDLVGITSHFTDNKYGWTNLSRASVVRVRNGYLLSLPRTELLD